jgi:two-component system, OmpR family, phosphate regulon sensor histidine kinase PhoR
MRSRFFWRITIPYVILIAAVLVGLAIFLANDQSQAYQNSLKSQLLSEARLISLQLAPDYVDPTKYSSLDAFAKSTSPLIQARITLIRPDGLVLGESDANPASMENHLTRPEVQSALKGTEYTITRFSTTLGADYLYAAVPVRANGSIVGIVRLAVKLQTIKETLTAISKSVVGAAAIAIGLAMLLSLLISYFTARPLRELTVFAGQMNPIKSQEKIQPTSRDEVDQLEFAINQMATNLTTQLSELQVESTQLSAVLNTMSDGIIMVNEKGSVQFINPASEKILGVSAANSQGQTLTEVVRNYQIIDLWEKSRDGHIQLTNTFPMIQNQAFVQAIVTPLNVMPTGQSLIVLQDLTRIHQLEQVRRDFVSNVSHELRTPMSSLKALVETLEDGAIDDKPAATKFLSQMDLEIDNLIQIVEELLELSRIESGKVPLKIVSITPKKIIDSAVSRMKLQAERAKITLSVKISRKVTEARADPQKIEQVLINLIHNAIKFTPPGGRITLGVDENANQVILYVQDTGIGIAPDDLKRVFERFYKSDRARASKGTGLGLSISRHLVEAHGGNIWAESELGKGSTFYLSLPKA